MNLENKIKEIKAENMPTLSNKNLFLNFLTRVYELFCIKLLNIRTIVFSVATYLVVNGGISEWVWIVTAGLFMGEKYIKILKELLIEVKK